MLNIQEFGFAVELFLIMFCGICCFFYSPDPVQEEHRHVQEPVIEQSENFEEVAIDKAFLESIIQTLSWSEAKSIVSELKKKKLTSAKLAGKGTGGTYFQQVIKTVSDSFEEDVRSVMASVGFLR